MSLLRARVLVLAALSLSACGSDGKGKAAPPTQSDTVEVPFQITTVYALEQVGDTDPVARARYYDAAQVFDVWGNAGTIALSPGDAAFADGTQLDIETRTEVLGTLRVDYSQTIAKGKERVLFELRRPGESIEAYVPSPEPFSVTAEESAPGLVHIEWAPVQQDSKVTVYLIAKNGCALFDKGTLANTVDDRGAHTWSAESFRSTTKDCEFDIRVERRRRFTAPARWKKGATELPTNGVHVEQMRTESASLTLARRAL